MRTLAKLLVIEDDRGIRNVMSLILEAEGFEVVTAEDGREALSLLERTPDLPDLILFDLIMPFMDGWEFRKRQLADPRLASIPALIVTAGEKICSTSLQVRDHQLIAKPIELDSLFTAIWKCLPESANPCTHLANTGS